MRTIAEMPSAGHRLRTHRFGACRHAVARPGRRPTDESTRGGLSIAMRAASFAENPWVLARHDRGRRRGSQRVLAAEAGQRHGAQADHRQH